jgi:tRNA-dihydrouridine synthase B
MHSGLFTLGKFTLANRVFVAPMAGVTDRPFRQLTKRLGAGYAVSEMAASNPKVWHTVKSAQRLNHDGEQEPIAVQIAGGDAQMMVQAAQFNVERGAQIIDINMGCPAKKVCHLAAGSALMSLPAVAAKIVQSVVNAVDVPVTVKMRTGPSLTERNAVELAKQFEQLGVAMLTIHGRTRACGFAGEAEYNTIAEVKASVTIPVVANGDIHSPEKALAVLRYTGADAVMVGRAAQGNPWLPGQIAAFLASGVLPLPPTARSAYELIREHLQDHYQFHGAVIGTRTARKHIGWYSSHWTNAQLLRDRFNQTENPEEQLQALDDYFGAFETGIWQDESYTNH